MDDESNPSQCGPDIDSSPDPLAPVVPEHTLLKRIGAGAYGEVWLARSILGGWRAVKIIRRNRFSDGEPYNRGFNGIASYAPVSLEEPSLLRILQVGREDHEDGGYFYYVMELADSAGARPHKTAQPEGATTNLDPASYKPHTLKQEQQDHGRLSFAKCVKVLRELSTAVQALHHRGLIHRDIKPSNVVFYRGEARLADIDLVAAADLTLSKVGSLGYMAPEGRCGEQTDIYALGKVLYEIATGMDRLQFPVLPSLRDLPKEERQGILELNDLVLKACATRSKDRYANIGELIDDLRWLEEGSSLRARRLLRLGLATSTGMVLLLAGFLLSRELWQRSVERLQRREQIIRDAQLDLQSRRMVQWSEGVWEKIYVAAEARLDDDVRALATSSLAGLDAKNLASFPTRGGSSVSFGPSGECVVGGTEHSHGFVLSPLGTVSESKVAAPGPISWAADGEPLQASTEGPGRLVLREVRTGRARQEWTSFGEPYTGKGTVPLVALASDCSLVAAAGSNGSEPSIRVWNATSGKLVGESHLEATSLAFSPDSQCLAIGRKDGRVSILAIPGLTELRQLAADSVRGRITSIAFCRDPHTTQSKTPHTQMRFEEPSASWLIAGAEEGGRIIIWNMNTGLTRALLLDSPIDVFSLAFHPDGLTLASAGRIEVRFWDTATGHLLLRLESRKDLSLDYAAGLAFSQDGKQFAVAGFRDRQPAGVSLWELQDNRGIHQLRGLSSPVGQLWFSKSGKKLAVLARNWQLAVWDLDAMRLTHMFDVPIGAYYDNAGCAFSNSEDQIAFVTGESARLYDLRRNLAAIEWALPPGLGDQVQFDSEDRLLLVRRERGPNEEDAHFWRLRHLEKDGATRLIAEQGDPSWKSFAFQFPAGGRLFLVWNSGKPPTRREIRCFDAITGKELWTHATQRHFSNMAVAVDPGGQTCWYTSDEEFLGDVIDLGSGRLLGHQSGVLALDPSGKEFLTASTVSSAWITRDFGGRQTGFVAGPNLQKVNEPKYSPDGRRIAIGTFNEGVFVVDLKEVQTRLSQLSAARH